MTSVKADKSNRGRETGDLGTRLRSLRTNRKLTLDQVSKMSGVSKAMLSQIEQNQVNPTVMVMLKIADALHVGLSELVETARKPAILHVISGGDERYTFRKGPGCTIRTLSPLGLEKDIEIYRIVIAKNSELRSDPHFRGAEELLYVAEGKVIVTSGGQTVTVARGDSAHYRADVPHALKNAGPGRAELFIVVRYRTE